MGYSQKSRERARIACGLNPLDPSLDFRGRDLELKSWHARWDAQPSGWEQRYQAQGGSSWYKSMNAQDLRLKPRPRIKSAIPTFSTRQATDHSAHSAVVDLRADGESIFAGGFAVKSVQPAGVDRFGRDLAEIETAIGTYLVEARELKSKG